MSRVVIPTFSGDAMQFSRLAAEYTQHLASPKKSFSPKTVESYALTYNQFLAYLLGVGDTDDVRHFTPEHIEGFVDYLAKHGIGGNSINVKLAGLSSLGRYAMRVRGVRGRYLVDVNPVDRVERPQKIRPNRKFLHADELTKLRTFDAPENETLARDLFIDTGLRVSELARANVDDLWMDRQERIILSVTVKGRGRAEEKTHIALDVDLAARLVAFVREREAKGKEPLLVNREGNRYTRTTLSEMMMRMGRRAGIDRMMVRPHALRHTYNMLARQAGIDPTMRAKLLNHSDTQTVQRYDHLLPEETTAARDAVRKVLNG